MRSKVIFIGLAVFAFTVIVWSAPNDVRSNSSNDEDDAVFALFGGPTRTNRRSQEAPKSMFDSGFWNSGVGNTAIPDEGRPVFKSDEEEPEILETASEGNPTNPQTGMPYTDDQMKQFDSLRERFPGNSIIPTRVTQEEQQKLEDERRSIVDIQQRITSKKASPEDISTFYDFQTKGMKDRVELLEYVLERMGKDMDADMLEKYQAVLDGNRQQIQSLENQKQKAIKDVSK